MSKAGSKIVWLGRGISLLPSFVFLMSAIAKLKGGEALTHRIAHLGIPASLVVPLAILELSCLAAYLIPPTSFLGAILLTGFLGGAICTHLRVGDPYFFEVGLGILLWLGLYLRSPRLRALLPLRIS